jgi:hypothetical protein
MFVKSFDKSQISEYFDSLRIMASFTLLSSGQVKIPFLEYRFVENAFCSSFGALNRAREDISVDATLDDLGVGIKTFLDSNGASMQKIAEFNKQSSVIQSGNPEAIIRNVSVERNRRLAFTRNKCNLSRMIYHCVTRGPGCIFVYEQNCHDINLDSITLRNTSNSNVIYFGDGNAEYSFNKSKSTLYKRFSTPSTAYRIPTTILSDPMRKLREVMARVEYKYVESNTSNTYITPHKSDGADDSSIVLPLYATSSSSDFPEVAPKSGLNQWAAGGRKRDFDEAYIPIPAWIHRNFEGFFPSRDVVFQLILPTGKSIDAKVCQQNSKALMSNPNSDLGNWLLRDILNVSEGEKLTYQHLLKKRIDSLLVQKISPRVFQIHLLDLGAYAQFESRFKTSQRAV